MGPLPKLTLQESSVQMQLKTCSFYEGQKCEIVSKINDEASGYEHTNCAKEKDKFEKLIGLYCRARGWSSKMTCQQANKQWQLDGKSKKGEGDAFDSDPR